MKSRLKRIRYRAEWLVVAGLTLIVPRFPRAVCRALATFFGTAVALLDLPDRKVALENLECAFGGEMPRARRKQLVRQSYQHFARAMADLYWSPRLTRENLDQFVDLRAVERLKTELAPGQSVIFACLHFGGFEWISLVLGLTGFNCTVVTQSFKNPRLNRTFKKLREVSGHRTIRREGAMLRLYKALLKGRCVTLAVDLTVSAKLPSVPIECFGLQTCVTFSHGWLQKRTGALIIPTHCEPLPDGRYRLVLHPALGVEPDATHQEIAQACWNCFEPVVRQNPAPWLWMYKHWRYRPENSNHRYPSYANVSPHFTELLKRVAREKSARVPAISVAATD